MNVKKKTFGKKTLLNRTIITSALLLIAVNASAATVVSLYSGTPDGNHPDPVLIGKTIRGDEYIISITQAKALVNYPDPSRPVIVRRVVTSETGGNVICPWYFMYDGRHASAAHGTRVNCSVNTHITFCGVSRG